MWKRLLVLLILVQWNFITTEIVVDKKTENIRALRQLNFGDCCPCPEQDASQDQDTASLLDAASARDDSCPCRSTSDTEGASSIFRPAFKAVEPLMRPVLKKEDPKPLLNPEVGLASSVLETLREVTDQEYQEALVRDAAKSVLKLMEPGLPETQSRNLVNIIVSPKDENNDDAISEASKIQGNSCLPPPLSTYNNFDHLQLHSPKRLLKQILSPPIFKSNGISNRNRNDMDGSASNTQELVSQPLKNNIFENMKTRLNLLNLKPLSNFGNKDFLASPKIFQKYNLKNNIRDRVQLRNKPLVQPRPLNMLTERLTKNNVGSKDIQPIDVDINQDSTVLLDKNIRPDDPNILRNTDCSDTIANPKGTLKDNIEDLDVFPSPSKVVEIKSPVILENLNAVGQEREADRHINEVLDTDTDASDINPSTSQTVSKNYTWPKSIEVATEVNPEDAKIIVEQSNQSETNYTIEQEINDDMESEPSITKIIGTDSLNDANEEGTSFTEDETKIKNANSKDPLFIISEENEKMANSKTHTLPNIKADILRTLEKFKKANEKIQEKLRSNVQDALQLVITNDPHDSPLPQTGTEIHSPSEIRASSIEQPENDNFTSITSENNINTEVFENTSESLLEQSTSKDDTETSMKSDCEVNLNGKSAEVNKTTANDDMIISPTSLGEIYFPKPFEDENIRISTEDLQKMSDSLLERSTIEENDEKSTAMQSYDYEKNSKDKSAEVDMITLPTSFDEKKYQKTFKDGNLDFDDKDHKIINKKPDEVEGNVCGYNIMTKDTDFTNMRNEVTEMNAQPSNSVFNQISKPDLIATNLESFRDYAVEPEDKIKPMEGIKDFFDSFRSFGRDTFTHDDGNSNVFINQGLFGFSNDENMASSKGDTSRFNSDTNLNYFKSKVASPKSLDIGSLVPTLANSGDNDADVLGVASQGIQETTNLKNVLEKNFKNGFHPLFKTIETPKMFQDTFNTLAPRLSDSFKTHKDNALKTFRKSLDVVSGEPFSINNNNLFGKSLINTDDLFGAVLKSRDDFHEKLQAFHSDLNRRFSSISPRISSLGDTQLLETPSRLKNTKTRADLFNKNTAKRPTSKNMLFSKNKPTFESMNKLIDSESKSSKIDMLKPNNKIKLGILQRPDSGLKRGPFTINPSRSYGSTKIPTKNNIKLKPLKENKVTISFATTTIRPDTLKFRSAGSSKLPKLTKSLKENKLKASKLESKDPKVSASEISISRAQLSDTLKKSKDVPMVSSIEESEHSLYSKQNDDNSHSAGIPDANKRKDLLLSKIKNAFATRTANDDTRRKNKVISSKKNENILDATQSASLNIDTGISATSIVGDTFNDNNRSFQCKMVCIKDILDSTDSYKT